MIKKYLKGSKSAKKAQILKQYLNSSIMHLWGAYERPSQAKIDAFNYCENYRLSFNTETTDTGIGYIISYNKFYFTYAFEVYNYKTNQNWLMIISEISTYNKSVVKGYLIEL